MVRSLLASILRSNAHPQRVPALIGFNAHAPVAQSAVEALGEQLSDLMSPLWHAVPKSKTTRSKKRMRAANKGLKNMQHITKCNNCGAPKLMHQLCTNCMTVDWNVRTTVDVVKDVLAGVEEAAPAGVVAAGNDK